MITALYSESPFLSPRHVKFAVARKPSVHAAVHRLRLQGLIMRVVLNTCCRRGSGHASQFTCLFVDSVECLGFGVYSVYS